MSDKIIDKINDGWFLLFCIVPFAICGYIINDILTNIAISVCWAVAIICFIIRSMIDSGYDLFGLKNYEISQGTINLLAIQYSILSIVEIKYHVLTSLWQSSGSLLRFILCVAGVLFLIMNVAVWFGFVVKKKDDPKRIVTPKYNTHDIPKDAACVFSALDSFEAIIQGHKEEMDKLEELVIPVPEEPSEENKAPFVDYLQSLSSLPKSHPEFAALEQFALMVADKSHLYDFGEELSHSLVDMVKDGWDYAGSLKDLLIDTKCSVVDYISNPTKETSLSLWHNIQHCMQHDIHGAKFHLDIEHARGLWGKVGTVLKHSASDTGKGAFETFFNEEAFHDLNANFAEQFSEHLDDIASSIPTDIDMDVWAPDFNADAHFPMISTAIELCRLGSKYADGDVDMEKAATKSGVKIGMTAGGAYLGGVIGSFLFPGVGTAVGAMIGGWLGRFGANKINKAETKRLQGELEDQVKRIEERAEEAKQNIEQYQHQTAERITDVAQRESENFEELKHESPLAEYSDKSILQAVSIIAKEYLVHFIHEAEDKYGDSKEAETSYLKKYLPSADQIKEYPKESLGLILSSQKYIRDNFEEDYRYNSELMNEICISSVVQKMSLTKTLQALWYNQVFNDYKSSVANIMQKSNDYIEEYVDNVDLEKQAIDAEVARAEEIKIELEKEMKTN